MLLLCGFDDDVCIEKRQHIISKKGLNIDNIDCEGDVNHVSSSVVSSCSSANVAHVDQFQSILPDLRVRKGHEFGVSETIVADGQFSSPLEDERLLNETLSCASSDISSLGRSPLNAHVNSLVELTVTTVVPVSVASTNILYAGSVRDSPSNSTQMLLANLAWPWSWFARCWNGVVKVSWIPYVIVITDMMRGFAAGVIL